MRHFLKKAIPIITILLISGFVFFGYNYTIDNLKAHLSCLLEANFDVKPSIGFVGLRLPLSLELKDVRIGDSVSVGSVRIYPNPASFLLKNKLIVSTVKIIDPVVKIKIGEDRKIISPNFLKKREKKVSSETAAPNFYTSKMHIENGTLIYNEGKEGMLEFVKIKANIEGPGIYFSKGNSFRFAIKGFLKDKDADFLTPLKTDGILEVSDVIKLKLQATDISVDTLGPIYSKYLSSVVEKGKLDFKSDVQISEANLIAKCFLEGEDIVFKKDPDKKIDTPFVATFYLLINFENRIVKIKNLQGNFLKLIFDSFS